VTDFATAATASRSGDLLLAIDCGTQSVRALLFDADGTLAAKAQVELDGYTAPQANWMEHDGDAFWTATAEACRRLWAAHRSLLGAVRSVAVTAQRGTLIPLGAGGRTVAPAIVWLDQRRAARVPRMNPLWRAAFSAAGVAATVRYFQHESEANWWADHDPALWAKTDKLLLVSGFLNWKLTGRFVDSAAAQVGYLPFDFRRHTWARPRDWKWQALAIRREQLPELVQVGSVLGEVGAEAAAMTGLPRGLPVIAAAADKACEVLGSGCIEPGIGALSYGTTATVNVCHGRYVEPLAFVPPYPAALPGRFACEVQIYRGYWMVRWFKEQFGDREIRAAAEAGVAVETLFDELVASVPPGSQGLMLQPYWAPGLGHPGLDAKGAIVGFGDVHTRAHVYRAILEGLAYGLRDGAERIVGKTKVPLAELRVSGGGSQSDAALQITADVFRLPASRPHTYETSGLGAAIVSAVALGLHGDFATAVKRMTRVARTFEPDAARADLYEALYAQVYRRMYGRLAPLYASIRRITGYPPA